MNVVRFFASVGWVIISFGCWGVCYKLSTFLENRMTIGVVLFAAYVIMMVVMVFGTEKIKRWRV